MTGRLNLRPYQEVDVRRAHEEFDDHVLLKHKQGVGKTIIATRICEEPDGSPHGPVTVICRSHLNIQWQRHLQREYPGAKIGSIVVETPRGRWRELDRQEKVEMLKDPSYDFRVLSFATPRRVKKSASAEKASGARTVREVWRDMAKEHGWVKSRKPKAQAFEYPLPPTRSLIVDECFTEGARISTPRGIRRIEDIRPGDEVWGMDGSGLFVRSKVKRTFRKPTDLALLPFGDVHVTPNHLVWTEDHGYTPYAALSPSDIVIVTMLEEGCSGQARQVEEVRSLLVRRVRAGNLDTFRQSPGAPLLRSKLSSEVAPQEQAGLARESTREHTRGLFTSRSSGAHPGTSSLRLESLSRSEGSGESGAEGSREGNLREEFAGRQWTRSDHSTAPSRDASWMGIRIDHPDEGGWREESGLSICVQGGRWGLGSEDSDRDRWSQPQQLTSSRARSEERRLPDVARVEGLASNEQASAEGPGSSDRVGYGPTLIYDLETETSNYFCEGVLVHNSHHARGRESQQYAGLYQMAVPTQARKAADRVVLISTTPAWREQDDLFTQLRLLDPKRFRGYWDFVQRYCILDEDEYGSRVVGGRTKRIAKLLQGYAITRDYSDPEVQLAVPDIIPEEVWVGLTDSGAAAYTRKENELKAERANGYAVGSGVTDYALITANDPNKLKALDDVIEELDGEPYALFCHWQESLELLGRHTGLSIYSGKSGGSRFTRADKIKAGGSFVGTIGSINEGVDLSHLRTMIFYETDYTFGAMDQVRTRLKRWRQDGSTDPIRCVYIACPGTVDEISYERSMQRGATDDEVMTEIRALAQKGRK